MFCRLGLWNDVPIFLMKLAFLGPRGGCFAPHRHPDSVGTRGLLPVKVRASPRTGSAQYFTRRCGPPARTGSNSVGLSARTQGQWTVHTLTLWAVGHESRLCSLARLCSGVGVAWARARRPAVGASELGVLGWWG